MKRQLLILALLSAIVVNLNAMATAGKDNELAMNMKPGDIQKVFAVADKTDSAAFHHVKAVASAHREEGTATDKIGVRSLNLQVSDYLRTNKGNAICERELKHSGHQVATVFANLNSDDPEQMSEIAANPTR